MKNNIDSGLLKNRKAKALPSATSIKEPTYTLMANWPLSDVIALALCAIDRSTTTLRREGLQVKRFMPTALTLTSGSSMLLTIDLTTENVSRNGICQVQDVQGEVWPFLEQGKLTSARKTC